ncbi:MAG TPA: glycine cleavage system aminomethyltransferase GcvT, partial [Acidimicrobiia bacterium]|nr:glycine cleavage system aminomethyltransferase GcvT [Acidimicrobiia bacterium]
ELGARFVDFGGWDMPLQYRSVLEEHRAVRTAVGWFDVSHLGRFLWRGKGSKESLRSLLSNDVEAIGPGRTQYSLLLNEAGGIEDDLLIWWWESELFWVLPNASTHQMVLDRFRANSPATVSEDLRDRTVMLAVQGPEAPALLETLLGVSPKRFRTYETSFGGAPVWLAGTGYTGERGGEIVTDPETARELAAAMTEAGATPCGLGSRDTLRLEAGLLLAGQDFDRQTNPFEARLDFAIGWDHDFVGKRSLERVREVGPVRRMTAFALSGRTIPRHGYRLRAGESQGEVTSGNFSPTLGAGIGLGYLVPPNESDPEVEIRGVWEPAQRVELPFYRR